MIYRGYSGQYKDVHLRSSLEFSYAYYLDSKNIKWKYELSAFDLDGISYKPDFFIFDDNDELIEIIEIKAEENRHEGEEKVNKFKEIYSYPIRIISYKDLLVLYKNEMPISLNKSKQMWINEYNAELKQNVKAELNPMFGKRHSAETKEKISKKTIERFSNEEFRQKHLALMIEGNKKRGYEAQKQPRSKRETRKCRLCNKDFIVTLASKQIFCSNKCTCTYNSKDAALALKNKAQNELKPVKEYIEEWARINSKLIQETKYNKISTTLNPLFRDIETKFNVVDLRTISKAVFGEDRGRKELLIYLKEIS